MASVSALFRSKERGTRVKDRAKTGASKRAGRGWGRKEGNAFLPPLSFFGSCFISRAAKTGLPSLLPHPLPALLRAPFFAQSCLTLVPRSLLLNRTETHATQATEVKCKQDESLTKTVKIGGIYSSLEEAFEFCWSSSQMKTTR